MKKSVKLPPENEALLRPTKTELLNKLKNYDVISFDVFDTLIFRAFSNPTDLFAVLGNRLNIMNFRHIRYNAEKDARNNSTKPELEINLSDIYDIIALKCGIDKNKGMETEIQTELDFCFANPYMKEIYDELIKMGKTIIAVSNMYLPQAVMEKMLKKCGYDNINKIFVSCDYGNSKRNGKLQKIIASKLGKDLRYIHIGDNYASDFEGSRKAGWASVYYKNVNEIGNKYRCANMSQIGGSVYKSLVNTKLHAGNNNYNPYYIFGYVYGGILACGYCEWLNRFAKEKDIDKFLFSSRDMYIVHKIYNKYYKKVDNDYIYLSRMASIRFAFERYSEHFMEAHIHSRALLKKITVGEILYEVDMLFLLKYLYDSPFSINTIINNKNFVEFREFLYSKKDIILKHLAPEKDAATAYYKKFTKDNKNICIVDLGWKGTNLLCLKYLLDDCYNGDKNICGALLGASNENHVDFLNSSDVLRACVFSNQLNKDLTNQHVKNSELRRLTMEILFTSNEDSLKNFAMDDDGNSVPQFLPKEKRDETITDNIHKGIMDFADDYNSLPISKGEIILSPYDMYLPFNKVMYDIPYLSKLFDDFEINLWSGYNLSNNNTYKQATKR